MSLEFDLEQRALLRLKTIRPILLQFHKDLMDSTKLAYEERYGTISSTGEYFRLVLGDEFFNWLRPISQFIVRIDERIAAKKIDEAEDADLLVQEAHALLGPIANSDAEHPYSQAIRLNPAITKLYQALMSGLDA